MAKVIGGSLYLEVRLSTEEVRDAAKRLAEAIENRAVVEGRIETFKAQAKADLAEVDAAVQKNTSMVSTEREFRLVPVEITFDYMAGWKTFVRKDTGEIVKREAITEAERQNELL